MSKHDAESSLGSHRGHGCSIRRHPPGRRAKRRRVSSRTGMVVCTSAPACDAGAAILARGGNAVDAAVATAFALAVTHPSAGNIGGGGFMIVRSARRRRTAFDFRETAPAASTRTMYSARRKDRYLAHQCRLPGAWRARHRPRTRARAQAIRHAAVEGARDAGSAPRGERLDRVGGPRAQPQRAARGHDGSVSGVRRGVRQAGRRHVGRRRSSRSEGSRPNARAIAMDGPDVFYKGWIADRIADDMAANGGLITKADLAKYAAKERKPVRGTYGAFEVDLDAAAQLGRGGVIEMLNILEPFHLKRKDAVRPNPFTCRSRRCAAPTSTARATSAIPTSPRCRSTC